MLRKGTRLHYPCKRCGMKFERLKGHSKAKLCPICRENSKANNSLKIRKFYRRTKQHTFINRILK